MKKVLAENKNKLSWIAIGITLVISILLSIIGIYWIEDYGIAIFILLPLYLGFSPTIIYGKILPISKNQSWRFGLITLSLYAFCLILMAIEGLICVIMAFPIAMLFVWLGSLSGYLLINKKPSNALKSMILLIMLIPTLGFIERDNEPTLNSVITKIEINADTDKVWKNVVEFPRLKEPKELIFKAGIAYPIDANIKGKGIGAIRYCNFTTGSFIEPITNWNEPHILQFDVVQQPEPMKELSFWNVDSPHLHDYFVSVKGQFKLIKLPNGNTLLEGTTWYYHDIKPEFYWQLWSEYIIHKIHYRVLNHIKTNSEK